MIADMLNALSGDDPSGVDVVYRDPESGASSLNWKKKRDDAGESAFAAFLFFRLFILE